MAQDSKSREDAHTYSHPVYNKGSTKMQRRKDSLCKWCWETWTATCKRIKLEHSLTPCPKIKQTKYLNVRLDIIKLIEENIGNTFFNMVHSKIFLDTPPRVMKITKQIAYN